MSGKRDGTNWILFFPDGIVAVGVLMVLPFWLASLLAEGAYQKAAILALFASSGVATAWLAWCRKSKWTLYAGMTLVLLGAVFTI